MSLAEIVEVSRPELSDMLVGCNLEHPIEAHLVTADAIVFQGWVVGILPVAFVDIECEGEVVKRVLMNMERLDVAQAYPRLPFALASGFQARVSLPARSQATLDVTAVLRDGNRCAIGSVSVRRRWAEDDDSDRLPLVSIIIPCFNQAGFLSESVESAIAQTHPNIEVIVVDDGSPDNTRAVAARYPGVVYVRQENAGLAAARNTGIRHSSGDFLVFLDADDRLLPGAVADGLRTFERHPEAGFVSGRFRRVSRSGIPLEESRHTGDENSYAAFLRRNYIHCPAAVIYRRAAIQAVSGFDSTINGVADMDMYLRISRLYPVASHESVAADYRQHGGSMSGDAIRMTREMFIAFRRQRRFAAQSAELRSAWREGLRFRRRVWGARTTRDVLDALVNRNWRRAGAGLLVLLRNSPASAVRVFQILLRSRPAVSLRRRSRKS
jgi:glycosyltransferase involved in cell wall biosynthesis